MSYLSKILLGVLAVAAILRLWGIDYGLPHFFVGDEQSQLGASMIMIKNFNPIPALQHQDFQLLYYPPLMSYFYLPAVILSLLYLVIFKGVALNSLADQVVLDPSAPWLSGRILIAALGVLTVGLIYVLARDVFNKKVGILAAWFLATSFLHVSLSHFTRHWVPTIFFEVLALIFAYRLLKSGKLRDYLLAGVAAALSFGVGFIGLLAIFFPVVSHFYKYGTNLKAGLRDRKIWLCLLTFALLCAFLIALYPQRFLELSGGEDISIQSQKTFVGLMESLVYHAKTIFLADPIIFTLAFLGFIMLISSRRRWLAGVLAAYGAIYISGLYFFIHNESRYISFLYPGLVILAALPIDFIIKELINKKSYVKKFFIGFLSVLLIYPLMVSVQFDRLASKPDTREQVKTWFGQNSDSQVRILSYLQPEVLWPNKEAIELQAQINPDSLRTVDRVLQDLNDNDYPKSFFVLNASEIQDHAELKKLGYDYVILQYWNFEQYIEQVSMLGAYQSKQIFTPSIYGGIDFLNNFDQPTFLLFRMKNFGPSIEIVELK